MSIRSLVRSIAVVRFPFTATKADSEQGSGVGYLHSGFLRRLEMGIYFVFLMPWAAFLPPAFAYGVACLRADLLSLVDRPRRRRTLRCLEYILGDQLSPAELNRVARDCFRVRSCEIVDVLRLTGKGQALSQLVEIRGQEHIEAALAAGKGAILCSAHFGSYDSCFSVLGVRGFPITVVGRWPSKHDRDRSAIERFIFQIVYQKPVASHRQRPNIEPRAGQIGAAVRAAKVLRQNELVAVLLDPPVLEADRERALRVDFLNGQALLLPGVISLAQLAGAPVLMTFMRRSEDWRHQVLEISPPISLDGDVATAFRRCLAEVEEAIRHEPAHWRYWNPAPLMQLGLLPPSIAEELTRSIT